MINLKVNPCRNGHDMSKIGAAYDPTDNTVVIFDGPGTALAIGYVNLPDAESLKHGHWDDSFDGITPYCSVCNMTHRCLVRLPRYCPNCGAKMDDSDAGDR